MKKDFQFSKIRVPVSLILTIFWLSAFVVVSIDVLHFFPQNRNISFIDQFILNHDLEKFIPTLEMIKYYVLFHDNTPLEEVHHVILLFMIFVLATGGSNDFLKRYPLFRWSLLGSLIFALCEELVWGGVYFPGMTQKIIPSVKEVNLHNEYILQAKYSDVAEMVGAACVCFFLFKNNDRLENLKSRLKIPSFKFSKSQYWMFIIANISTLFAIMDEASEFDIIFENAIYLCLLMSLCRESGNLGNEKELIDESESLRRAALWTSLLPVFKFIVVSQYQHIQISIDILNIHG